MLFRNLVADDPYLAVGLLANALLDGKDNGPCFCPFLPLEELPFGDFGRANLTGILAGDALGLGDKPSLVVSSSNFTLN